MNPCYKSQSEPKKEKGNYLWVVEAKTGGAWQSTVGAGLTRKEARVYIAIWRKKNANREYRIRKYIREEK
jgi:hypothetical protein